MTAVLPPLTPLEIASGLISGTVPLERPRPEACATPMDALEASIRTALQRPPCVVAFSGGRDSSAVLAVAARVAQREGLEPPIAATNRFPAVPTAEETAWQERVVQAVRVEDWVKLEHEDELDCVGPVAARALRRHGLLWPFNAHFVTPFVELARGGSLLTGLGGDELLGETRWARAATVLAGRDRPTLRDTRRIAFALAPNRLRAPILSSRVEADLPWLRPYAREAVRRAWVRDSAAEPFRWARRTRWMAARRYLQVGAASLALVGRDEDVRVVHPLNDPRFVETLARAEPSTRFFSRTEAMELLFGSLLPADVLRRTSKSSFDGAFFNEHSRAFVASWDGGGVDQTLVNSYELKRMWQSETPDARTLLLLQATWLASTSGARSGEERVGAVA